MDERSARLRTHTERLIDWAEGEMAHEPQGERGAWNMVLQGLHDLHRQHSPESVREESDPGDSATETGQVRPWWKVWNRG